MSVQTPNSLCWIRRGHREVRKVLFVELKPQARPQHVVLALWKRTGCDTEIVPLQDSLDTLGRQDRLAGGMGIPFRCFSLEAGVRRP